MRSNTRAVSPVIAVIMVMMIVTSITATIFMWGEPRIQNLQKTYSEEAISSQMELLDDSFDKVLRGLSGSETVTPISLQEGSSVDIVEKTSRTVLSYSYDENFNFSVSEFDDITSNSINVSVSEGSFDKAEVLWLNDSRTCFLAGAEILMADGSYKNIEDIKIGDMVCSYNEETESTVFGDVCDVFYHESYEMNDYYLVINDDICVTPNHRFYSGGEWIEVGSLDIGDQLFCINDSYSIYSIKKVFVKQPSYDLNIGVYNNYFVHNSKDDVSILVHNDEQAKIISSIENDLSVGRIVWVNERLASGDDGMYAQAISLEETTTCYLRATDFGFSIPSGSTIQGIEVEVEHTGRGVFDNSVKIIKSNGAYGSENKAKSGYWLGDWDKITYGSSSDLWSEGWSVSDINNRNFGVGFSAGLDSRGTANVDYIKITVYYSTETNSCPEISNPNPDNSTTGVSIQPTLSIDISDPDGDTMSLKWFEAQSLEEMLVSMEKDAYVAISTDLHDDTYQHSYDNATEYETTYWWGVKVSDETDVVSSYYSFETESLAGNPPTANDDTGSVDEDGLVWIDVLDNDVPYTGRVLDESTVTVASGPSHGETWVNTSTGEIRYIPTANFYGNDSFTYTVKDDEGVTSNQATVNITINSINDVPSAVADDGSLIQAGSLTINLANNDNDIDDGLDLSSIVIKADASHGNITINGDGTVTYDHDGSSTTSDTFSYSIKDFSGAESNTAAVDISLAPANQVPVAEDDIAEAMINVFPVEHYSANIFVLNNDDDPDGTIVESTLTIQDQPDRGTAVVESNFQGYYIEYTYNNVLYEGTTTLTYTVKDNDGEISNLATVTIILGNAPPIISSNPYPSDEATGVSVSLSQLEVNIYDDDGSVSWTIETSPFAGSNGSGGDYEANGDKTCDLATLDLGTTYIWYVNATDGVAWTNETFTFTTQVDLIDITSPDDDDVWYAGSTHNITWTHLLGSSNDLDIGLFRNDDLVCILDTVQNTPGVNSWTWNVPYNLATSDFYSIGIRDTAWSSTEFHGHSEYFTIKVASGHIDNETIIFQTPVSAGSSRDIDAKKTLEGSVLIELWSSDDLSPKGKILIVDSDAFIGKIESATGIKEITFDSGWVVNSQPDVYIKKAPNNKFINNNFAIRIKQIVKDQKSINSMSGNINVKVYSKLHSNYNREQTTSYNIMLYYAGDNAQLWKQHITDTYSDKFSVNGEGLFYNPSSTGSIFVLIHSTIQLEIK